MELSHKVVIKMSSAYWDHIRQFHYQGPVWELPNGKQLTLDYQAVSLLMDLLKQGSGDCFLHNNQAQRGVGVTHTDALWARYDGERVFFEMFRSYPKTDSDLMQVPGMVPVQDPEMDPNEVFWSQWEPDYTTSVTWQWLPAELATHLSEPEAYRKEN